MEYLVWKAQNLQIVLFLWPSSVGLFSQSPPNRFLQSAFRRSKKKEDSETRPQMQKTIQVNQKLGKIRVAKPGFQDWGFQHIT